MWSRSPIRTQLCLLFVGVTMSPLCLLQMPSPCRTVLQRFGTGVQCYSQTTSSQDYSHTKHRNNLEKVRNILLKEGDRRKSLRTIDSLQRMAIDHHFKEEIEEILESDYKNIGHIKGDCNLVNICLQFRLLRQARCKISHEVFKRFIDTEGRFKLSLTKDIKGLLSLYEASQLNEGEDILYIAREFSRKHLISSMSSLDSDCQRFVTHTLEHPCHMTLQRYRARHYLTHCQEKGGFNGFLQQVARFDFNMVQSIHQKEFKDFQSWWEITGFPQELSSIRDEPMKWYLITMAILPHPVLSKNRIKICKVVALIYVIDDIFDIYGSLDELCCFTKAIHEWGHSATDTLPTYMRACYTALYELTDEVAQIIEGDSGWNSINSLRKMWMRLFDAFLMESKWFASEHVPQTNEYMTNGIISSGVHVLLVHIFFLLGEGITTETVDNIESIPTLISAPATLLRLWDDLGSAKDEKQYRSDGSYVDCYMKEHPDSSPEAARENVMNLILCTWECLNKELFSPSSYHPYFVEASLNSALIFKVMNTYNDHNIPVIEEYVKLLLLETL